MVPVPVISGPTAGRVIEEEIVEWARQARRWTIGAAEVFHYFVVKSWDIPFLTAMSWGITFILYYGVCMREKCTFKCRTITASLPHWQKCLHFAGVMLCCSSLYSVSLAFSVNLVMDEPPDWLLWTSIGFLAYNYLIFAVIFVLDRFTLRLTQPRIQERISLVRQLYQLLLSPFVLLGYSLVELFALHEVMIKGKEVCKHGASKKEAL